MMLVDFNVSNWDWINGVPLPTSSVLERVMDPICTQIGGMGFICNSDKTEPLKCHIGLYICIHSKET
jgi:hypothetical protein